MANTNKTKADILQELESLKGLLLEEDDIPILQDSDIIFDESAPKAPSPYGRNESILPGQTSLFGEQGSSNLPAGYAQPTSFGGYGKHPAVAPAINATPDAAASRSPVKATGENPFLPQHIRERLHGNNPPPLFEYEAARKIISATNNLSLKEQKSPLNVQKSPLNTQNPRKQLVEDVIASMMPQIESELRHRLFAMSVDDLEKILNDDDY